MRIKNSEDNIINTAALLKAIGHPIRVQIILVLSQKSYMTVTELSETLEIDQPVMSLHLAILRKQNVIAVKKYGKTSKYSMLDVSVRQIVSIVYYSRG
mgnify:CR=1 FL=1|tara:strand:- start:655 stop:948 length:294 start_codon:yes stop_codon:yes gene_type:complete